MTRIKNCESGIPGLKIGRNLKDTGTLTIFTGSVPGILPQPTLVRELE